MIDILVYFNIANCDSFYDDPTISENIKSSHPGQTGIEVFSLNDLKTLTELLVKKGYGNASPWEQFQHDTMIGFELDNVIVAIKIINLKQHFIRYNNCEKVVLPHLVDEVNYFVSKSGRQEYANTM